MVINARHGGYQQTLFAVARHDHDSFISAL
jgi:hypothetical protein